MIEPNQLKILVVDDEPEILDLLNYNFTKKGLDVYVAGDGRKAFDLIQKTKPDMIILDIMMPEMNGIQFCELIRSKKEFQSIPVLFLSASSDDLLILSAMTSGGNDFASKPIRLNILYDMVMKMYQDTQKKVA